MAYICQLAVDVVTYDSEKVDSVEFRDASDDALIGTVPNVSSTQIPSVPWMVGNGRHRWYAVMKRSGFNDDPSSIYSFTVTGLV